MPPMGTLRVKPKKPPERRASRWVALVRRLPKGALSFLLFGACFAGWATRDLLRFPPGNPGTRWLYALAILLGTGSFLWSARRLWLHVKPSYVVRMCGGGFTTPTRVTFRYRYHGDASQLARVTFAAGYWHTGGMISYPPVDITGSVVELPREALAEGYAKLDVPPPKLDRPPTLWVEITDRNGRRRGSAYRIS